AVARLPPEQREAILLRLEAGLGLADIAQVTGVNPETAKSRLRYAVRKLKAGMKE
ncbi:MAG: RNA polymerase subunit sigma-24, partial [Xanthomonadales bacterium]|nr:RNA polymerase subunit sigma-24 [Xanthomonadales bacterium]